MWRKIQSSKWTRGVVLAILSIFVIAVAYKMINKPDPSRFDGVWMLTELVYEETEERLPPQQLGLMMQLDISSDKKVRYGIQDIESGLTLSKDGVWSKIDDVVSLQFEDALIKGQQIEDYLLIQFEEQNYGIFMRGEGMTYEMEKGNH